MNFSVVREQELEIPSEGWLDYARLCEGDTDPRSWLDAAAAILEDRYDLSLRERTVEIYCIRTRTLHVPYRHIDQVEWVRPHVEWRVCGDAVELCSLPCGRADRHTRLPGGGLRILEGSASEGVSLRYRTRPVALTAQVRLGIWHAAAQLYHGEEISDTDRFFGPYVKSSTERFYEAVGGALTRRA